MPDLHVGLLAPDLTHKHGWAHYSLSLIEALQRAGVRLTVISAHNSPPIPGLEQRALLVDFRRLQVRRGFVLLVTDRGRQMVIRDAATLGEILARDFVAMADREGRPLDVPSFREGHAPPVA